MTCAPRLALVVLCLVQFSTDLASALEPVTLALKHHSVELPVGHPPRLYTFRLNHTLDAILLHADLSAHSDTFYRRASDDKASDYVHFADHAILRVPFHMASYPATYSTPEERAVASSTAYSGTLGLGKYSPIWRYWRNATVCAHRLDFNVYRRYAQRNHDVLPVVLSSTAPLYIDNYRKPAGTAQIAPQHLATLSPRTLDLQQFVTVRNSYKSRHPKLRLGYADNHTDCAVLYKATFGPAILEDQHCENYTALYMPSHTLTLPSGKSAVGLQRTHTLEDTVQLGEIFLQDYVWFRDMHNNLQFVSLALDNDEDSLYHALALLFLLVALVFWFLISMDLVSSMAMESPEVGPEKQRLQEEQIKKAHRIDILEGLIFAAAAIFLVVDIAAHESYRLYADMADTDPTRLLVWLIINQAIVTLLAIILLVRDKDRFNQDQQGYRHDRLARFVLLLGAALPLLWLLELPDNASNFGRISMYFYASALAAVGWYSFLIAVHWCNAKWPLFFLLAVAWTWFLVDFTLVPLLGDSFAPGEGEALSIIFYMLFLGIAVLFFVHGAITMRLFNILPPARKKLNARLTRFTNKIQ